ncbi:hypothetical protein ACHAWC_003027 [Mediolabrus comicus]
MAALSQKVRNIAVIITLIKIAGISFYFGYINAINENNNNVLSSVNIVERGGDGGSGCITTITPALQQRIDARIKDHHKPQPGNTNTNNNGGKLFPDTTRQFVEGILSVSNKEFLHNPNYDFGVPFKSASEHADALILYNTKRSIPTSDKSLHDAAIHGEKDTGHIAKTSMSTALENCDAMNVIFLPYGYTQTRPSMNDCYTIMGNFESYHINRYFRMPDFETTNKHERELKPSHPLRHFGRVTLPKGIAEFDVPEVWRNYRRGEKGFVLEHFDALRTFVENVDTVQSELKELITKRNAVRDNTVVVMTVNVGQSELLANFVCAARSRGLDISNVVVFPTDIESKTLAEGLGVTTYFDEKNLGALPKGEARMYGDKIFASMMYAKILCVVYVSMLGYDVLFQDVDMVWFKDPLEYFHDPSNTSIQNFDILFQHDGSGQMRYNPLSANSGFYYVRANKKAQYVFTSLLYHGAFVRKSKSHQQVLVQLLLEHSSMFGTKVKVFDKLETDMFPGGYHYHQHWDTIKDIVNGKSNAYLLHMSWTENKDNKLKFFRQMGEWYLQDHCISNDFQGEEVSDGSLISHCCSAEPIFSCHFRDKPSKKPCWDSPCIDKRCRSFWQPTEDQIEEMKAKRKALS